jgi:plastocyanin
VRRSAGIALGLALSAVVAAPAQADTVAVAGLDTLTWDKPVVDVKPNDTVVWTFGGTTQFHNVWSEGINWVPELRSPLGAPAPDAMYTFTEVGEYAFLCQVHPDTMRGVVRVSVAPPPPTPEPPLSEQAFLNDDAAPVAPETAVTLDTSKPGLASVAARRVAKGAARVRFKVSENSDVSVAFKRGGRTVKSAVASGTGTRGVTVRGLRAGRYVVQVRATDIAGNRSKLRTLRLDVR